MNQTAESGSAAVFSCTVSGFPFAWFEWFKDGANVLQLDLTHDVTVQVRWFLSIGVSCWFIFACLPTVKFISSHFCSFLIAA